MPPLFTALYSMPGTLQMHGEELLERIMSNLRPNQPIAIEVGLPRNPNFVGDFDFQDLAGLCLSLDGLTNFPLCWVLRDFAFVLYGN